MKPFIKWAGGKRWLAGAEGFKLPEFSGMYIEPFLGGGAVFFEIMPESSILSDVNSRLIETYKAIAQDWRGVQIALEDMQRKHSKEFYYTERKRVRRKPTHRAAQFLYLNRTCWNGLYRENLKGQFNVPIGTKSKVIFEDEDFAAISAQLQKAEISCCDFAVSIGKAEKGDLIFADPPYTVAHNLNGFVKYNQNIFSWEDQVRLRDALVEASKRGAIVVVTNADHASIRDLYREVAEYRSLSRASVISGSPNFRRSTSEALLYM